MPKIGRYGNAKHNQRMRKAIKQVSIQFGVSNAFDETYYTCYDTSNCWFGADRSFELTGRYEF